MSRVVVLASGAGSLFEALVRATSTGHPACEVVGLVTDRAGAGALGVAAAHGVPSLVVAPREHADRAAWDSALAAALTDLRPEWVVSAGFMRILGPAVLAAFEGRIVNSHPALLPAFPGAHAVRDALAHGARVTGCTVHLVDAGVDTGPVLAQDTVRVLPGDDEATLHERIKVVERELLVDVVAALVVGGTAAARGLGSPTVSDHTPTTPATGTTPAARSTDGRRPVRRALVSVYDKSGVEELAQGLHEAGVELVSTGSTAARISAAGVPVTPVEDLTGFPECLDGRVKTLHPRVHAGLLADTRRPEHVQQLADLGIAPFDLVVANLYPFADTVAAGAGEDEVVEQIDIGGPAMVRASAKNSASLAVVVDPARYGDVLAAVAAGGFTAAERTRLAAAAFAHTAAYDVAVAGWFAQRVARAESTDSHAEHAPAPAFVGLVGKLAEPLRYGENPHQHAALYRYPGTPSGLAGARQLHGKAMSYNNYVDTDAAVRAAHDHGGATVAIIKHANPCGIATASPGAADPVADAHAKAHACDPVSAFGGVVAANRTVTRTMAEQLADVFTEVVAAPGFEPGALELLQQRKNVRLLVVAPQRQRGAQVEVRPISGGVLVQQSDRIDASGDEPASWRLAAGPHADPAVLADLTFAWRAVRAVKSNAILLARDGASVGVGMGQVNRVDSCRLAVQRAGEDRARGSVAASDAFFPFPDGLQVLIDAGVSAVVQPGGSVRDAEVVAAAEQAGVSLYLTGVRHFAH